MLVVAVIVAVPLATAVTVPAELTVATAGSLELQLKTAFFSRPFWKNCAANCCVPPGSSVTALGVTTTLLFPPVIAAAIGLVGSLEVHPTNPSDSAATDNTNRLMTRPRAKGCRTSSRAGSAWASRNAPKVMRDAQQVIFLRGRTTGADPPSRPRWRRGPRCHRDVRRRVADARRLRSTRARRGPDVAGPAPGPPRADPRTDGARPRSTRVPVPARRNRSSPCAVRLAGG